MKRTFSTPHRAALALLVAMGLAMAPLVEAAGNRGGGGHGGGGHGGGAKSKPQLNNHRTDARTNNVRSTSVNNVNNTNVNVNRNVNVQASGGCCNNGWDNDDHPIATAAAVTATVAVTSAIVGSIVNAPPPGCVPVNYGGYIYQQCGSTWYQPQGSQYVVIAPPY